MKILLRVVIIKREKRGRGGEVGKRRAKQGLGTWVRGRKREQKLEKQNMRK